MPAIRGIPEINSETDSGAQEALTEALIPSVPEQSAGQVVDTMLRVGSEAQTVIVDPVNSTVLSATAAGFIAAVDAEESLTTAFSVELVPDPDQSGRSLTYSLGAIQDLTTEQADAVAAIIAARKPTFTIASLVNAIQNAFPDDGIMDRVPAVVVNQHTGKVFVCFGETGNQLNNALDEAESQGHAGGASVGTFRQVDLAAPDSGDDEPEPLIFEGGATSGS